MQRIIELNEITKRGINEVRAVVAFCLLYFFLIFFCLLSVAVLRILSSQFVMALKSISNLI